MNETNSSENIKQDSCSGCKQNQNQSTEFVTDSVDARFILERQLGNDLLIMRDMSVGGQLKCVKQVRLKAENAAVMLAEVLEEKVLSRHKHHVTVHEVIHSENQIHLVLDYCEGGSLSSLMSRAKKYEETLNEVEVMDWLIQILLALQSLHSKNKVHGCIQPSNILLCNNAAKIGNRLALKRLLSRCEMPKSETEVDGDDVELHVAYTAPEVIAGAAVSQQSDMWSVGCVLYQMCTLRRLFRGNTEAEIKKRVKSGVLPNFSQTYPSELCEVWHSLMESDPAKRGTVESILEGTHIQEHLMEMESYTATPRENWAPSPMQIPRPPQPPRTFVEADSDEDDEDLQLTEENIRQLLMTEGPY